jgi:hypothetical protein
VPELWDVVWNVIAPVGIGFCLIGLTAIAVRAMWIALKDLNKQ